MQQKSAIGASKSPGLSTMLRPFLAASVLAAATVAIGGALLYGPEVRASLDRQWAAEIERENGEVCASFGMTSASGQSTCAEALARVRRQHEERLSRDSIL
jgi:hypothetical protein